MPPGTPAGATRHSCWCRPALLAFPTPTLASSRRALPMRTLKPPRTPQPLALPRGTPVHEEPPKPIMTIFREVLPPEGPPGHKGSTEGSKKITVKDRVPREEVSSRQPPPFLKHLVFSFSQTRRRPTVRVDRSWGRSLQGRLFLSATAALACSREPTTLVVQADLTMGHVPSGA